MLVWLLTDADMTMSPRLLDDINLARGRRKNELQSLSDAQTRAVNLQSILLMPLFRQCYFFAHLISVHNKIWFSIKLFFGVLNLDSVKIPVYMHLLQ